MTAATPTTTVADTIVAALKTSSGMTAEDIAASTGYTLALVVGELLELTDSHRVYRDGTTWYAMPEVQTYERRIDKNGTEHVVTVG